MIRVLLVDDQTLIRQGIRLLLEIEKDIQVVGQASNGLGAVEQVRGGGQDEPFDSMICGGLQEVRGIDDVVAEVQERFLHRLADEGVGCKVHNAIGSMRSERGIDHCSIFQITEDELCFGVNRSAMPARSFDS